MDQELLLDLNEHGTGGEVAWFYGIWLEREEKDKLKKKKEFLWVDGREPKVLIKQNCSTKSFGSLASHLPAPRPHHSQPVGAALLRLNSLPACLLQHIAS